jgi:hypothetical protein
MLEGIPQISDVEASRTVAPHRAAMSKHLFVPGVREERADYV